MIEPETDRKGGVRGITPGAGVFRAALREHGGPFARDELPPFSRRQIAEEKIADPDPDEAEGRVAHGGGHAADLAVFSFGEFAGEPGVGDVLPDADRRIARREGWRGIEETGAAGPGAVVVEGDVPAGESLECVRGWDTFHLGPVFAAMGVYGIE